MSSSATTGNLIMSAKYAVTANVRINTSFQLFFLTAPVTVIKSVFENIMFTNKMPPVGP